MDEIRQILDLVRGLEKKVRDLEEENQALKHAILSACDSLTRQNSELHETVATEPSGSLGSSGNTSSIPSPSFKPPKWFDAS